MIMEHAAKDGLAQILRECTLPLTARRVVHRIITELATIDIGESGLVLREIAPDTACRRYRRRPGRRFAWRRTCRRCASRGRGRPPGDGRVRCTADRSEDTIVPPSLKPMPEPQGTVPETAGDRVRQRILDVAEAQFAERGFFGASVREVTEAAGVRLAAVNYHFETKEELFRSVLLRRAEELGAERLAATRRDRHLRIASAADPLDRGGLRAPSPVTRARGRCGLANTSPSSPRSRAPGCGC